MSSRNRLAGVRAALIIAVASGSFTVGFGVRGFADRVHESGRVSVSDVATLVPHVTGEDK